jgi:hypothetical protein
LFIDRPARHCNRAVCIAYLVDDPVPRCDRPDARTSNIAEC